MAITLKEENILDEWSTVLEQARDHSDALLEDMQRRLEASQIPGGCTWALVDVQSSAWVSRVRREFLVVQLEQFKDYRMYIAAREYGIHLDVCRFLTVEPGFFKKALAEQVAGDQGALSTPKNILLHQDLRAWVTVVHRAVVGAVEELMKTLGQDTSRINRKSKGFLEIW